MRPSFAERWYTDGTVVWSNSASGPAVCQMRPLGPNEGTLAPIEDEVERKRCAAMIAATPILLKTAKEVLARLKGMETSDVLAAAGIDLPDFDREVDLLKYAVDVAEGRRP